MVGAVLPALVVVIAITIPFENFIPWFGNAFAPPKAGIPNDIVGAVVPNVTLPVALTSKI